MLTNETKRKLASTAMFAMPIAFVWVTSMVIGGPDSARADDQPTPAATSMSPPGDVPGARTVWTDAQQAAIAHIGRLRSEEFGPTPLYYQTTGGAPMVIESGPNERPVPSFAVKGILAAHSGNTAIIQGRVYHVGEWFEDSGWQITEIDAETRSVTIEDPDTGRVIMRSVNTPGLLAPGSRDRSR